ncbi:MAG: pyridoxal phosphate-dependent aminotransferase family protein, partial [Candidatus Thermoplasmatota archaeon]|nr:pyridoxal phosphate-dependent aminotransferase family protein [Candidatus Thermoplasmatota archaeon]
MNSIQKKCKKYERSGLATVAKRVGLYPYFKQISSEQGPIVRMEDREIIMLGSNNYLGMTGNPIVKEKALEAMEQYGVGTTGSRLLNGTFQLHVELEKRLAAFLGKEDCVAFSTGMQANLGAISSLLSPVNGEYVLSDELNHASIIDALTLSKINREKKIIYKHNDMDDLQEKIEQIPKGKALIITEGVFSMEGDIPPLDKIVSIAKKHKAMIYLDDAHGLGVLGPEGRGAAAHFDVTKDVDVLMGTFSKSFASCGGYIASSKTICNWVRHHARSFIFSASMPPANCATVLAVLDLIEQDNSYRKNVLQLSDRMRKGLIEAGFDIGKSTTPVIPIFIGDDILAFRVYRKLFRNKPRGIFTNPIRPPAVPHGQELLRTSYMATMTEEIIDEALEIITTVGKK